MTINASDVPESKKRLRQEDDRDFDGIAQKISRIDELTMQEARRLLFDSDPYRLQQGLDLQTSGNLRTIHYIHEKTKEICNPAKRKDRSVLRIVNRIPDVLAVSRLLSPELLSSLQGYLLQVPKQPTRQEESSQLVSLKAQCVINADLITINFLSPIDKNIGHIFVKLFQKALNCAYELDGQAAFGNYHALLLVVQQHQPSIYSMKKGPQNFHHDFMYDEDGNPSTFAKYSFLGMLSDREGEHGWNGGDLLIQNDSTSRPFVPDQKHLTSLCYQYPLNEGILLRNKNVTHKVTEIGHKDPENPATMARDLLAIVLFKAIEK